MGVYSGIMHFMFAIFEGRVQTMGRMFQVRFCCTLVDFGRLISANNTPPAGDSYTISQHPKFPYGRLLLFGHQLKRRYKRVEKFILFRVIAG